MDKKEGSRPRGRPRIYEEREGQEGAPTLSLRLDPDVRERIKNHPKGARKYVEGLVREDVQRTGEQAVQSKQTP